MSDLSESSAAVLEVPRASERMAARSSRRRLGERDSERARERERERERERGHGSDLVAVQCPPPIKSWGPVGCARIDDGGKGNVVLGWVEYCCFRLEITFQLGRWHY